MWIANNWKDYEVLDTSAGEKLERWGKYILVRPDPQVIWDTPTATGAGGKRTATTTAAPRAAANGNSLTCRRNGPSPIPCPVCRKAAGKPPGKIT